MIALAKELADAVESAGPDHGCLMAKAATEIVKLTAALTLAQSLLKENAIDAPLGATTASAWIEKVLAATR